MTTTRPRNGTLLFLTGAMCALVVPWTAAHAVRDIRQDVAADPAGSVDIISVSGSVDVRGWDKSQIEVTGSVDDAVERVDVASSGARATVRVVPPSGSHWGGGEARLIVHVPAKSALTVNLVSAELKLDGLLGEVRVHTVSGDVSGDVGADLHANTVSGSLRMTAKAAHHIDVRSVSGDIDLAGGGGDVDISTISGTVKVELASIDRGRFKSVSGQVTAAFALADGGQLEAESVSGDLAFDFARAPAADVDVETFSGDIDNCFGPKPIVSRYGPGSTLRFTNGEGHGQVHVETHSGDVRLCTAGARAWLPPSRLDHVSLTARRAAGVLPLL